MRLGNWKGKWIGLQLFLVLARFVAAQNVDLTCSLKTEFPSYPCGKQTINVVLSIEAPTSVDVQPPLLLTSVMDKSGSMKGPQFDLLKKTNQFLLDKLGEGDGRNQLGIVTYSTDVQDLLRLQPLTSRRVDLFKRLVDRQQPAGFTNLSGGLLRGLEQHKRVKGQGVRAVFLFTDGKPTKGITDLAELVSEVKKEVDAIDDPIALYTFGLGEELSLDLLFDLADIGNGVTYIISSEEDIPDAFGDALGGLLSVVAVDLKFTLRAVNGAKLVEVKSGGQIIEGKDSVELLLGDMFVEERRDILITLEVPDACKDKPYLEVEGDFVEAGTAERGVKDLLELTLEASKDTAVENPDPLVESSKVRFATAESIASAKQKADKGDIEGAVVAIAEAQAIVNISSVQDDPTIKAIKADLETIRNLLEDEKASNVTKSSTLQGVTDALTKQRSGLTDDQFETAKAVETETKKQTRKETKTEVLAGTEFEVKEPPTPPPMPPPPPPPPPPPSPPPLPPAAKLDLTFKPEFDSYTKLAQDVNVVVSVEAPDEFLNRAPLSLSMVLDRSGSMEGPQFVLLKKTMQFLVDTIAARNATRSSIGFITYDNNIDELLPLEDLSMVNITDLKAQLDALETGGRTDILGGTKAGIKQQLGEQTCAGAQAVFLFTDGVPTEGETERSKIVKEVEKQLALSKTPIAVSAFGLGENLDIDLLFDLSEVGKGSIYFIQDELDIPGAFGDALGGLLSIVAKNIKLTLKAVGSAKFKDVQGGGVVEFTSETATISFSDLFLEERRDILVTVDAPKGQFKRKMFTVELEYEDAVGCRPLTNDVTVSINRVKGDLPEMLPSSAVEESRVRFQAADAIDTAQEEVKKQNVPGAVTAIATAEAVVNVSPVKDDPTIAAILADLRRIKQLLEESGTPNTTTIASIETLGKNLKNQRATVTPVEFESKAVLDTGEKAAVREEVTEGTFDLTPEELLPLEPIIECFFDPDQPEYTNEAQNVSVLFNVLVDPPPQDPLPVAMLLVLDTSKILDDSQLAISKKFALEVVRTVVEDNGAKNSAIGIVTYGSKVKTLLKLSKVKNSTLEDVQDLLDGVKLEGEGDFLAGLTEGVKQAQADKVKRRKAVVVLSGSVNAENDVSEVGNLLDKVPVDIFPVGLGVDRVDVGTFEQVADLGGGFTYFLESEEDVDSGFLEISDALTMVGGQNVVFTAEPGAGVVIHEIQGGVATKTKSGYSISMLNLLFNDWQQLKFDIELPEGPKDLEVVSIQAEYFDVGGFRTVRKGPLALEAVRGAEDVLVQRDTVRQETGRKLDEAEESLIERDTPAAVIAIAEAVAIANVTISDDPVIKELQLELKEILKLLEELNEKKEEEIVADDGEEALEKITGLKKETKPRAVLKPDPDNDPEKIIEKIKTGGTKPKKEPVGQEFLELSFSPENIELSTKEQNVSVAFKIKAPENPANTVNASIVMLLDMSEKMTKDKLDLVKMLIRELLDGFSKRQGVRAVRVMAYNEKATTVVEVDDVVLDNLEEILGEVDGLKAKGKSNIAGALVSGIKKAAEGSGTAALWWFVGTAPSAGSTNPEKIYDTVKEGLSKAGKHVTIFPFVFGMDTFDVRLADALALTTGGVGYYFEGEGGVAGAAAEAVRWFDSVAFQKLQFVLTPFSNAQITSFDGPLLDFEVEDGERVIVAPDILYDEEYNMVVNMLLPEGFGDQLLLRAQGSYISSLSQDLTDKESLFLIANRATPRALRERNRLRDKTQSLLNEAEDNLVQNNPEVAAIAIARAEAIVTVSPAKDDPVVQEILAEISRIRDLLAEKDSETDLPDGKALEKASEAIEELVEKTEEPVATPVAGNGTVETVGIAEQSTGPSGPGSEFEGILPTNATEVDVVPETGITLAIAPEFDEYRDDTDLVKAELKITGPAAIDETIPLSITLVIDGSSDMTKQNLGLIKNLLTTVLSDVNTLDVDVEVGMVVFGKRTKVLKNLKKVTEGQIGSFLKNIDKIKPAGKSVFLDGLLLGLKQQSKVVGKRRRMVFLFTGSSPSSSLSKNSIQQTIATFQAGPQSPITIIPYVFNFAETNVELMEAVAQKSGGLIYFLEGEDDLDFTVEDTLDELTRVAVQDVRLRLQPEPGVKILDAGTRVSVSRGVWTVAIPDILFDEPQVVEITMKISKGVGRARLLQVSAEYFDTVIFRSRSEDPIFLQVNRATPEVLEERKKVRTETANALDLARELLTNDGRPQAVVAITDATAVIKDSQFQDDPVISNLKDDLEAVLETVNSTTGQNDTLNRLTELDRELQLASSEIDLIPVDEGPEQGDDVKSILDGIQWHIPRFNFEAAVVDLPVSGAHSIHGSLVQAVVVVILSWAVLG